MKELIAASKLGWGLLAFKPTYNSFADAKKVKIFINP
jgi:hypothetical protein